MNDKKEMTKEAVSVLIDTSPNRLRKQILAVMQSTIDASAEVELERVYLLEGVTELLDDILVQIDKGE